MQKMSSCFLLVMEHVQLCTSAKKVITIVFQMVNTMYLILEITEHIKLT